MKVKIIFAFAFLLVASLEALPSKEAESEESKTEIASPLIEALENESEDASRSKKSSDVSKTLCKEIKTEDGKSFLQCHEEEKDMEIAGTHSYSSGGAYGGYGIPSYKVRNYFCGNFNKFLKFELLIAGTFLWILFSAFI